MGRDPNMGRKGQKNGSRRGDLNLGCIFSLLPLLVLELGRGDIFKKNFGKIHIFSSFEIVDEVSFSTTSLLAAPALSRLLAVGPRA